MSIRAISTAIAYPNAKPHLGHALELVQADFLARSWRQTGAAQSVYFQTGVDEHGLKIAKAATAAGQDPAAFVDQQLPFFQELAEAYLVSADRFIRTTEAEHQKMAQALWRACEQNGDIYKKTYRAWYNVKEEEFLGSADEHPDPSVFGIDQTFIELIEEENYFFKLSRYQGQLLQKIDSKEYEILPANRADEMRNFAEGGLQDVSISRAKEKLSWGVPVPGDEHQVMYVWFDALTNYLTGVASVSDEGVIVPDERWPYELHCVGKDVARFHALLWPAMLLSAGLELPKRLLVHGFILSEGRKMSKSLGNVVDPMDVVNRYGPDAVRWFLLAHIPTQDDGDFTEARLAEIYRSDLANDYGNLVSRTVAMTAKYFGEVPPHNGGLPDFVQNIAPRYQEAIESLDIALALSIGQELVVAANRLIEREKPWELAKDDHAREARLAPLLYQLLEIIRLVTVLYAPAIPQASAVVREKLFSGLADEAFYSLEWGQTHLSMSLPSEPLILFPRVEEKEKGA